MNFLQKGLAGLESRLDMVLLDEPDRLEQQAKREPVAEPLRNGEGRRSVEKDIRQVPISTQPAPVQPMSAPTQPMGTTSRSSMQERLAAAMARKVAAGGRSDSPVPGGGSDSGSRTASPAPSIRKKDPEVNGRASLDSAPAVKGGTGERTEAAKPDEDPLAVPADMPLPVDDPRPSTGTLPDQPTSNGHNDTSRESLFSTITLLESRLAAESLASSERIDALEGKLRYLARTSAETSRRKASSTPSGGLEKRLAEAQEKIALLLEEGEKLSKNELKLQNTIKKLRLKTSEEEKAAVEAKRGREKAEREVADCREKLRRAAEESKRDKENLRALGKVGNEIEGLRRDRESALGAISVLKEKLAEAERRAEDAEGRVQTEALEKEREVTSGLKVAVDRIQSEAAIMEERLKDEVRDLRSKMERDAERARIVEQELKGEQMIMESKMESLRARAEEVSSGASGDAHAKLLRQVETLQTQYAIASENWQGIEGSMLGRIASLEKERDDLAKKEGDIRRKARELSTKSKNLDMDLDTANSKVKDLEGDLSSQSELTQKLRSQTTELETSLADLRISLADIRTSFSREKESWQRDLQSKLEEERTKWQESSRPSSPSIPHSPFPGSHMAPPSLPPIRKSPGSLSTTESYFLGFTRKPSPAMARSPSSIDVNGGVTPVEFCSRPSGRHGFSTPPIGSVQRQDSGLSLPQLGLHNISRTSLLAAAEEDDVDYFENIPFSPHRAEMVSVSTVAAGPSVQLVERMSATVRRLESEMAGAREEVAAITTQRDEARQEIVELMREVETKRGAEERVKELEKGVEELRRREETTLEMLGEKSELVEELRADVADLKQMYRDLVSDTMR